MLDGVLLAREYACRAVFLKEDFFEHLSEPDIPFPVEVPPRIRADLHRLGTVVDGGLETGHFRLDNAYPAYLERKRELLRRDPFRCRVVSTDDEHGLRKALERVRKLFASEYPDLVKFEQDAQGETTTLARLGGWEGPPFDAQSFIEHLADSTALWMQEDFVIVHGADEARAELLHVCFPSRWSPREKIGRSFMAVHEPVADNAALIAASRSVARAMVTRGPFVRFVWSITTDPRLEQHPEDAKLEPDDPVYDDPDALALQTFFRVERQTTFPMPDLDRALFTIRVYVQPLTDAVRDPFRRMLLAAAMREMSPALSDYKGYSRLREPILNWLSS